MFAKLRWFYEEMPSLPVVAAGSLLDLTLGDGHFSMPVGRVSFQHVEPMGFPEFLEAHGQQRLLRALEEWRPGGPPLPEAAHERATEWLHRYSMVGGMPAVVAADAGGRDARACRELQRDLAAAFRADFAKYSGRMHPSVLDATLRAVAGSLGRKLVYAQFGDGVKQHQARRALELLAGARVCHLVRHSAANGLPLGAEAKDTFRKAILADVGLAHALLGTPAAARSPPGPTSHPPCAASWPTNWRDSSCVSSTRSPATVRSSSTGSERAADPGRSTTWWWSRAASCRSS